METMRGFGDTLGVFPMIGLLVAGGMALWIAWVFLKDFLGRR